MRRECEEKIAEAVGRPLAAAEVAEVEARIARNMRQLAKDDPDAWRAMSQVNRLLAASDAAARERVAEGVKKAQRVALQVAATSRALDQLAAMREHNKPVAGAVVRVLEQADVYVKGTTHEYFSALMDTLQAAEPRFFGLMENPVAVRDFVRAVFGEKTGNQVADTGAQAWLQTIEQMRQRFNRSGGSVRKLDYGYLPQPHDAARVGTMAADLWAARVLPLLDRSRYLREDGVSMADGEVQAFLAAAHETISTGGLNKLEPGSFAGAGMRANRGGDPRQIHFKDADSYLAYMGEFGRGSVFDAMQGHVGYLARDIGLVESLGPNPEATFRLLHDTATKADGGERLVGPLLVRTRDVWAALSGYTSQTAHARLGEIAQGVRNYTVAAKLQGTLLSSFTDIPTLFLTARFNDLPTVKVFANVVRGFGGESREYANRIGLVADSVISDMNRWAEGNLGQNWTSKLANTTMRLSLLNAWTDALRRGFSVTMMGSLGKLSRTEWSALAPADRTRLAAKGITADD